ncbi:MAG: hypothetical protein IH819_06005 [Bacteroidetes bacterium]|nr:hypothetical protein [Bacteroidota bacterium]
MATIIPKLDLVNITDGDLEEYALDKVVKINAAGSSFPGLTPTTGQVGTKANDYKNALVATDEGTKAQTSTKDTRRRELEGLLTLQAQNCAEIADGDIDLYLLSGYEAKDVAGSPVGELAKPDLLTVDPTDNIGQLKIDWNTIEHADNHTVRAYTDEADPEDSLIKAELVKPSKFTMDNLPSGTKVFVDVRANGGSEGHGPWSDAGWARPR